MSHPALTHVFAATHDTAHYVDRVIQLGDSTRAKTFCGEELASFHLRFVYDLSGIAGAPDTPAADAYRGAARPIETRIPPSIEDNLCTWCVTAARKRVEKALTSGA